ncbi:hypothetical protein ASE48_22515 [Mycobacterium sp. Root265]|uniref:bifunctional DNA primase/polymerase n=1 Tax=Mycobacterium sp. Root265 TaxID=1736504 RepID=UPI00070B0D3C|nr:bifunctional DNA primase/polymerase [Mycobacterium sp. Root265]KRD19800.1 hypothetical protein ASE48_22515 [Mycobacterium sp. Root265]
MIPDTPATKQVKPPLRDDLADYGAYVEDIGNGELLVEIAGMDADEYRRAAWAIMGAGWGVIAVGRINPHKPDDRPGKVPWDTKVSGWTGVDRPLADVLEDPERIARRIVNGSPERGVLNIALRMPVGVAGIDVDQYGPKHGLTTVRSHEQLYGDLPPTWRTTARDYDTGSGIRFYRVPADWVGVGVLNGGGDVEVIQRHHRCAVAPGGVHHTGATYQLYGPGGAPLPVEAMPRPDELPELPAAWCAALRDDKPKRSRRRGQAVTSADVTAFADEYTLDQYPNILRGVVATVLATGKTGGTRNACLDALWRAAHDAVRGYYPWTTAYEAIRTAAIAAYTERGGELDEHDFDRMAEGAIAAALDANDDDPYADLVEDWGEDRMPVTAGGGWLRPRPAQPRTPRRPKYGRTAR